MYKKLCLATAATATALCAPNALAQDAAPAAVLEPSSPWHLEASDTKCRLARQFGEGENQHILFMETGAPSANVDLLVGGPATEATDWDKPVQVHFGALPPVEEKRYSRASLDGYRTAVSTTAITLDEPEPATGEVLVKPIDGGSTFGSNANGFPSIPTERFEGVDTIRISQGEQTVVALKVPNLQSSLEALNECGESFIEFWGLDLAKHRTMQRGPVWTNINRILRRIMKDYPSEALRREEQGKVRVLVIVDEKGQMVECREADATELRHLEAHLCSKMKYATFDPALDANGQPMRSYLATSVRYVLP